ncbi:unnamed protein product [marine sediment metagenome]|uniref:Uncharacterized protein n=1 Tax=marine sediment metagenome TaxID=412755 RepID=X1EKA0_9ZZZZ
MLNRDDLKTEVATIGAADANVGSAIPQNMRRFIYAIKAINIFNGANLLTIGKRENGAGATTIIDYVQAANQYDMWKDPDELLEDSAPICGAILTIIPSASPVIPAPAAILTVRVTSSVLGAAIAIACAISFTSLFYLAAIDLGVGLQPEKGKGG